LKPSITILNSISIYRLPIEKIRCLVQTSKKIEEILAILLNSADMGADYFLPCFSYVLLGSNIKSIYSELLFMDQFIDDKDKGGMEGYLITQLQVSIQYFQNLNVANEIRKLVAKEARLSATNLKYSPESSKESSRETSPRTNNQTNDKKNSLGKEQFYEKKNITQSEENYGSIKEIRLGLHDTLTHSVKALISKFDPESHT